MAHPLMMPFLSVNVDKVCFGTFQSNCRDVIWPLIPDCDIYSVCDIPSNYDYGAVQ